MGTNFGKRDGSHLGRAKRERVWRGGAGGQRTGRSQPAGPGCAGMRGVAINKSKA